MKTKKMPKKHHHGHKKAKIYVDRTTEDSECETIAAKIESDLQVRTYSPQFQELRSEQRHRSPMMRSKDDDARVTGCCHDERSAGWKLIYILPIY